MGVRQDPIPFRTNKAADEAASQVGHALGTWVSALRRQAQRGREQASRAADNVKHYWDDVKEPQRRESRVWSLVIVVAVAGLVIGLLLPRRD